MKRIHFFIVITLLGMALSSCSKDNTASLSRQILGTWKLESSNYVTGNQESFQFSDGYLYTFKEGGVCIEAFINGKESVKVQCHYSVKDNYLNIGETGYQVSFQGDKMLLAVGPLISIFTRVFDGNPQNLLIGTWELIHDYKVEFMGSNGDYSETLYYTFGETGQCIIGRDGQDDTLECQYNLDNGIMELSNNEYDTVEYLCIDRLTKDYLEMHSRTTTESSLIGVIRMESTYKGMRIR